MTQGERIRKIRKMLKMTMEQFGEKIGVTKSTISNIENGNRNATEHMLLSICRAYDVNENWLRTGEGSVFVELPPEDEYIKAATQLSNDPDVRSVLIAYWKQDEAGKAAIKNFLLDIFSELQKGHDTDIS